MPVLTLRNISKSFPEKFGAQQKTLTNICLTLEPGEVFALVGPNGSGKTTLIRIIMSLLREEQGETLVFQEPLNAMMAKKRIGYMPELPQFPGFLTARQLLELVCELYESSRRDIHSRVEATLDQVGLKLYPKTKISHYSKGMTKRLALAQALVTNPDLLILDEPMDGLDPVGMHFLRAMILDLKHKGKTVFFTSHLLGEIEKIADRVGFLKKGELVYVAKLNELKQAGELEAQYLTLMEESV